MRIGLSSAPVGQFVVGDEGWIVRQDVLLPPRSLDQTVCRGGGVLGGSVLLGGFEMRWESVKVTAEVDKAPSRTFTASAVELPKGMTLPQFRSRVMSRAENLTVVASVMDPRTGTVWPETLITAVGELPSVELEDSGAVTTSLAGSDASLLAKRAKMVAPYAIAPGMTVTSVIRDLLSRHIPWLPQDLAVEIGAAPAGAAGAWGADPWQVAQDMAHAAGAELRVDRDGFVRMHWTSPRAAPLMATWSTADGTAARVSIDVDGDALPEAALIEFGSNAAHESWPSPYPPGVITVVAEGDHSGVTDAAQARDIARIALARARARYARVDATVPVDYRRDVGDRVRVVAPEIDVDVTGQLTGITWELGSPVMTVTVTEEEEEIA